MCTCSHSQLRDRLYVPLYPVRIPTPFSSMRTAALVTDILRSPSRLHTCPCDPVVLIPISSSSAELYFPSAIIISLSPLKIALRTTWLLSCSLDEVSDVGMLLETSISSPSTDTSIRDCLHLSLGLSGHSR